MLEEPSVSNERIVMTPKNRSPLPSTDDFRPRLCLLPEVGYPRWKRGFTLVYHKLHPAEMGAEGITRCLFRIASERQVIASRRNPDLRALLLLWRCVLDRQSPRFDDLVEVKPPQRLPLLSTRDLLARRR